MLERAGYTCALKHHYLFTTTEFWLELRFSKKEARIFWLAAGLMRILFSSISPPYNGLSWRSYD